MRDRSPSPAVQKDTGKGGSDGNEQGGHSQDQLDQKIGVGHVLKNKFHSRQRWSNGGPGHHRHRTAQQDSEGCER